MYRVLVPATSANLGPGFDCVGIALNLYNEVEVYSSEKRLHLEWEDPSEEIPLEDNLVYTSIIRVFHDHNFELPNAKVVMKKLKIPVSRGLGSSSAAIVAGLTLGYAMMGRPFDKVHILKLACDIEGHPDNVAPTILGGMNISIIREKDVISSIVKVPDDLRFIAVIPPYKVSTLQSRRVLPKAFTSQDAIANVSRAAILINSFATREYTHLRVALDDRLHQPYRLPLLKDSDFIIHSFKKHGALGEFISGSGSTMIGIFKKEDASLAQKELEKEMKRIHKDFEVMCLDVDREGVQLEYINEQTTEKESKKEVDATQPQI